jgi:hypothetical protein
VVGRKSLRATERVRSRAEAEAAVGGAGQVVADSAPGGVVAQGTVTCCFCEGIIMPMSENFFGPVTIKDTRHFAHVECALWCPEVGRVSPPPGAPPIARTQVDGNTEMGDVQDRVRARVRGRA